MALCTLVLGHIRAPVTDFGCVLFVVSYLVQGELGRECESKLLVAKTVHKRAGG